VFYPHWSPTPLIAGIPAGFFLYFFLKPLFVALITLFVALSN